MLQLGKDESAAVLGHLNEAELEDLSTEIARIGTVNPDIASAVLAEFAAMLATGAVGARGGMDLARELLYAAVGEERAAEILERLSQSDLLNVRRLGGNQSFTHEA